MSTDVLLMHGLRTVLGLSLRVATSVDEVAERVEGMSLRALSVTRWLPLPRQPEEL